MQSTILPQRRPASRSSAVARPADAVLPNASTVLASLEAASELDPLVSPAARAHITELASTFPVTAQTVCYECWLGEGNHRVDLALALFPGFDAELESTGAALDSPWRRAGAWRRCLSFLRDWERPGAFWWPRIPFTWVAFDLDRPREELPAPCLGLCVEREFLLRRRGIDCTELEASAVEELAEHCYAHILGESLPGELREKLQLCDEARRDGLRAKHVSFMFSRSPQSFKLDVELPVGQVANILDRLGYPGPTLSLQRAITSLVDWNGAVQLNLTLYPELSPILEVELLTLPSEATLERRRQLLARLSALGLVSHEKATALRQLAERPVVSCADGCDFARSWYLKVRFHEDRPFEAKAYVGIMPRRR